MKPIDTSTWPRREHFAFFQSRQNPRLAVTASVCVENLMRFRQQCGDNKPRLSDCLYYAIMQSANAVPELRLRLVDLHPVEFERLDAGFTYVPKGRSLHCNCVCASHESFTLFAQAMEAARQAADAAPTLTPAGAEGQGLIYMSNVPNVAFTAVSNPWGDPWQDSVPRVVFGKIDPRQMTMPVALEALHSFVDGRHVGAFFEGLEQILADPERAFMG
jgi:chloramphenicol O-acetyltransferase type A